MINIQKQQPPRSLQAYRANPSAVYDGPNFTAVKSEIRAALVAEQHTLCAYCMRRIQATDREMKVEHWQCQDYYPHRQLDYANLLGVCKGHEGQPVSEQTCDTCKGNATLKFNPADPTQSVASKISYTSADGSISSSDEEFDAQIGSEGKSCHKTGGTILNLNLPILKLGRMAAIRAAISALSAKPGERSRAEVERMINKLVSQPIWPEFAGATLFILQKRLQRAR